MGEDEQQDRYPLRWFVGVESPRDGEVRVDQEAYLHRHAACLATAEALTVGGPDYSDVDMFLALQKVLERSLGANGDRYRWLAYLEALEAFSIKFEWTLWRARRREV